MNIVEIKELNVIINLNDKVQSIVGSDDLCKKTLLNKIINKIDNKDIYIDNECIKSYDIEFLRNNIMVVFNNEEYKGEFVIQELAYNLNILGYSISEIDKRIGIFTKYFKIKNIIDNKIDNLKVKERILIKILSYLIIKPRLILLDNLTLYLDNKTIKNLITYCRNNNICLVNVTTDPEFLLISDFITVLNDSKCILQGTKESILSNNSILPFMGINLPFIVELSQNLILYGLVDKNYYEDRKLVDKLWK